MSESKKKVMIVESPSKTKTLSKILGKSLKILASKGHVRDLPKTRLGIDIDNNFEPTFRIMKEKSKLIEDLRKEVKDAKIVYLAPDPDREGEAIAWHLKEVLNLKDGQYKRVYFNEITEKAVKEAMKQPRDLDTKLIEAQKARRILDRIIGYKISPFLWKTLQRGLSAGRVQSVALRMVVEREREIRNFEIKKYYTFQIKCLDDNNKEFTLKLCDKKYNPVKFFDENEAEEVLKRLDGAKLAIKSLETKEKKKSSPFPFITSTLQQEAQKKHGFSLKKTMKLAQSLYEGLQIGPEGSTGLITYMRTDSFNVSLEAQESAKELIIKLFGEDFYKKYYPKKNKGSQEAHEAIRPTSVFRLPDEIKQYLGKEYYLLYDLIWKRFMASQMANAIYDSLEIKGEAKNYNFFARFLNLKFPGYMVLWDEEKETEENDEVFPKLTEGKLYEIISIDKIEGFLSPPPRYTEATLVKRLEELGIGRPSTYAPTIITLQERNYVRKEGKILIPTKIGEEVTDILIKYFPNIVDYEFTAKMESDLDKVFNEEDRVKLLKNFYQPFEMSLHNFEETSSEVLSSLASEKKCPICGSDMKLRISKFGRFYSCSRYPECKGKLPFEDSSNSEQNSNEESLKKNEIDVKESDVECPICGSKMVEKRSKFGKFLACSRYPECKGTLPYGKKVEQRCPKCGGQLIRTFSKKGKPYYKCVNKDCDFYSFKLPGISENLKVEEPIKE
ncbi:DNA topoisomerase I [Thermodesulfobium narugense DSM 14796]|uniref:DNA topoisomerase 1 n=1 Tax=Thermodesulfobium narugense DSM 14796 TaxID=747365 RepID=M1E7D1_9BACT|nr:type I DNA topoisomerase [Thermodesulfobium narugense]AEE14598.1 DNA topoisomerase I [Thermodesulfobium narugense DSM 14796]